MTEQGIRLRLPTEGIAFFFGAANCKFTKEGAAWPEADQILNILQRFLKVLANGAGVTFGKKNTILTLHLQPQTTSFKELLLPFIDERLRKAYAAPLDAMALVVRWPGRRITLDGSAQLANGIFAQIEREFPQETALEQIKQDLFDDETSLFNLLDVTEVET